MADKAASVKFDNPCIIAAVIWYSQTNERLERLIASLQDRVQGAVFLDGPFAGLSKEVLSPEENYFAIADACIRYGVPYRLFEGRVWSGEPQKRTAAAREALAMASELMPNAEPWVLVLDSDEWLMDDIDWSAVEKHGHGSGVMQSFRDGRETSEGGTGSKMVRLFPNSVELQWGPTHFDVRTWVAD